MGRLPRLSMPDAAGSAPLVVQLEGVTDADNVGGVYRNETAFDAGAVLLSPTCGDPLYRKAVRTAMGHVLRVPFAKAEPWPSALEGLRASGFIIAGLSPRQPSTTNALQDRPSCSATFLATLVHRQAREAKSACKSDQIRSLSTASARSLSCRS